VVQFVSEERRACVLLAADGAHPTDNARGLYMNTGNGAVQCCCLIVCARVKANSVLGARASRSGRREATREDSQDSPSANERQ
jgi:hypothetical protein